MTIVTSHGHNMSETKQIPAGEFKAKCLKLMDEVQRTGEEIVITKHGKPVAKLSPVATEAPPLFGSMKGSVIIHGDIVGPTGLGLEEEVVKSWDRLMEQFKEEEEGKDSAD